MYTTKNKNKMIINDIYLIYSFLFASVTSINAPFGFNSIVLCFPKPSSIFNVKFKLNSSAPSFSL